MWMALARPLPQQNAQYAGLAMTLRMMSCARGAVEKSALMSPNRKFIKPGKLTISMRAVGRVALSRCCSGSVGAGIERVCPIVGEGASTGLTNSVPFSLLN